jgi:hypothetical protein
MGSESVWIASRPSRIPFAHFALQVLGFAVLREVMSEAEVHGEIQSEPLRKNVDC